MIVITLPYPDKDLFPNKKNGKHWSSTDANKKAAINAGFVLTKNQHPTVKLKAENVPIKITYYRPDPTSPDLDNLLAASKAMLDGVALALKVDDKYFRPITIDARREDCSPHMLLEIGVNN